MKTKLFSLTSISFSLPSYLTAQGNVAYMEADSLPLIRWPDGLWCYQANAFAQHLFIKGRARRINGGTLGTYISHLSLFIRHCYYNKIQFHEISDSQFTLFMRGLIGESVPGAPAAALRDANTVNTIMRITLDFLDFIGELYGIKSMVGPQGQVRVTIQRKRVSRWDGRPGGRLVEMRRHVSAPMPSPRKRGHPISIELVNRLRASVQIASTSNFIARRRYVMLMLLEATGARRAEISTLLVNSVTEASKMEKPMLLLRTVKKGGDLVMHRLLPISRSDLKLLLDYIRFNRMPLIRKTCGADNDDGTLLISESTGAGLRPNTITQEIHLLARLASIESKACPHMFRHRFITKLFISLSEHYKATNVGSFRNELRDNQELKAKISEWTGHSNLASLDHYIDLAFAEFSRLTTIDDSIRITRAVDTAESQLADIMLGDKITKQDLMKASSIVKLLQQELKDAKQASAANDITQNMFSPN